MQNKKNQRRSAEMFPSLHCAPAPFEFTLLESVSEGHAWSFRAMSALLHATLHVSSGDTGSSDGECTTEEVPGNHGSAGEVPGQVEGHPGQDDPDDNAG